MSEGAVNADIPVLPIENLRVGDFLHPVEMRKVVELFGQHPNTSVLFERAHIDPPGRRVLLVTFDEGDDQRDPTQHRYLVHISWASGKAEAGVMRL